MQTFSDTTSKMIELAKHTPAHTHTPRHTDAEADDSTRLAPGRVTLDR